jgi:hypothetical protein
VIDGSSTALGVSVSDDPEVGAIRNKYWVINRATVENLTDSQFKYNLTYYHATDGFSGTLPNAENYLIAPMQVFLLQASKDVQITLDPSELMKHGPAQLSKSASQEVQKDWFFLEVEATKDNTKDRTSIRFSEDGRLAYDNVRDTQKGIASKSGKTETTGVTSNLLYTKSSDGIAMLGKEVPTSVVELPLYYVPPTTTQTVKLRTHGLDQLESVQNVWLVDKYENRTVKLTSDTEYEFVAQPEAATQLDENRFVLRFQDADADIIGNGDDAISCYYNSSTLYIDGLTDEDKGSMVQVFDMQGRLVMKDTVDRVPSDEFSKMLAHGTYVLKITGKRSHTAKFVSLN